MENFIVYFTTITNKNEIKIHLILKTEFISGLWILLH